MQVLLKRCSENVSQDPPQLHEKVANHLHDLIITISQLPDSSCFTEALTLCLEHRGTQFTYFTGTKVQILTLSARQASTSLPAYSRLTPDRKQRFICLFL